MLRVRRLLTVCRRRAFLPSGSVHRIRVVRKCSARLDVATAVSGKTLSMQFCWPPSCTFRPSGASTGLPPQPGRPAGHGGAAPAPPHRAFPRTRPWHRRAGPGLPASRGPLPATAVPRRAHRSLCRSADQASRWTGAAATGRGPRHRPRDRAGHGAGPPPWHRPRAAAPEPRGYRGGHRSPPGRRRAGGGEPSRSPRCSCSGSRR